MTAKKNKSNASWVHAHINDPYVKMAQKDGYRARAAYKLKEIDDEYHLIKSGMVIVDLGSTPGSWSQIAREKLTSKGQMNGRVIALDLLPMEPIADVDFILGDFREDDVLAQLQNLLGSAKVDLVLSDMAPNLSGVSSADSARIEHIVELAVDFSLAHLKPDGALIVKAFHGSGFSQIVEMFKKHFKRVVERKPKASRDRSSETFIVGRGLKEPK